MGIDSVKMRAAMITSCLTIKELAQKSGLAETTIQMALKSDGHQCNTRTIGKLSKALNVPASVLIKNE
jgi:hypothetical protein